MDELKEVSLVHLSQVKIGKVIKQDLTTKDNVTRDSFQDIKCFAFIVASSVRDTNRMTIQ